MPRSLHSAALESLLSRDLTVSLGLVLAGTYGYGSRRSANGYNMPRAQELTVESIILQGDTIITVPDLIEDADLAAENITLTLSPPEGTIDAYEVSRHRSSPPDAANPPETAALYLLFGDGPDYLTTDGTAVLIWQGRVASHKFAGAGNTLTLTLEPLWANLALAPGLRYDPQDQYRLFAGDTGLDACPATRRKLALSAGTATPAAEQDPALLQAPPRRLVYGTQIVQGDIVLLATSGASSRYLNLLIAFAAHEVAGLDRLWLDGREVEFTSGDTVGGNFAAVLTVSRKLGTTSQTADSSLTTELGTTLWPSTSRLKGIAYVSLRLLWDPASWSEGIPIVTALVRGKLCLDPRDTGAAAAHSTNPAVQLYDYLLDTTHGPGLASSSLDTDAFAEAAEACDEAITLATGFAEPRYTAHLAATHEDTREDVITRLLSTCAGQLVTGGSTISLLVGTSRAATAEASQGDVLALYEEESLPAADLRNTARGSYTSTPSYTPVGYPAVILADWQASEGERLATYDFPAVTSPTQAQRLAKLALLQGRRRLRAPLVLPLAGYRLQVGDVLTLTVPGQSEDQALDPVEMRIAALTLTLSPAPKVTLSLIETGSSDYAWTSAEEGSLPTNGPLPSDITAWRNAKLQSPSLDTPSKTFGTAGTGTITVALASTGEPGATVYYTTDGSDPTTSSASWTTAQTFTATTTVKLLASASTLLSDIVTYLYSLRAPVNITVAVGIPGGHGTVTGTGTAAEASTVTLTATGSTGYGFVRWTGAYKSEVNPLVFTAGTTNINLIATFGTKLLAPTNSGYRIETRPVGGYNLIQRITNPSGQAIRVRWSTDNGLTFTSQITTLAAGAYVELIVASGTSWAAFTNNYRFADGSTLTYGQSDATAVSYAAYP